MVESLVPFPVLQRAGYGNRAPALMALCKRYDVPVMQLSGRQYALRESDYRLLLSRMTVKEPA